MSNRQLKFRVWDKKYNRFIGDGDGSFDSNDGHGLTLDGEFALCSQSQFGYVDPEHKDRFVIQQWTGLTDKEGKDIYEGDIIYFTREHNRKIHRYNSAIIFQDGMFGFLLNGFNDHFFALNHEHNFTEVLGNIFEHPTLLP